MLPRSGLQAVMCRLLRCICMHFATMPTSIWQCFASFRIEASTGTQIPSQVDSYMLGLCDMAAYVYTPLPSTSPTQIPDYSSPSGSESSHRGSAPAAFAAAACAASQSKLLLQVVL